MRKHTAKHSSIAFLHPAARVSHPDKLPPSNAAPATDIMTSPRSFCPTESVSKLFNHVGSQANIAHNSISIEQLLQVFFLRLT